MTKKINTMMVYGFLKDGNEFSVSPISGKELIERIWTDDYTIPPESLILQVKTKDGQKNIRIVIPFDETAESYAILDSF
jgi:hypothetical protein